MCWTVVHARTTVSLVDDSKSVDELVDIVRATISGAEHGGSVITVCEAFDENQNKHLNLPEFTRMLRGLGFSVTDSVAQRLFEVTSNACHAFTCRMLQA